MRITCLRQLLFGTLLWCRLPAQPSLTTSDWALRYGADADSVVAEPEPPSWRPINLGISWERQDFHNGGVAWLRKDFTVPDAWANEPLSLAVRMRAEQVDVFVNGDRIGHLAAPDTLTTIEVPAAALRSKTPNALALRVTGHAWTGGSCEDVVQLLPRSAANAELHIEERFARKDHVFSADAEAAFETRIRVAGVSGPVSATAVVISDFHAEIYSASQTLDGAQATEVLRWTAGRLQPGFYQVQVRLEAGGLHAQRVFWFAVDPTRIPSSANPPADLAAYWDRAKRELAAVPPNFRVSKDPNRSNARHNVYTVEMDSVEGVTLRAWYIVPTRPGPHPAVLDVPGYSVAFQPEWFRPDDDLIRLALDIRGHGRSSDVINPGFGTPGYVAYRVNEPEHFIYKGAYLDCGRALEFLASRPEVDAKRIAVMGGSQGGGLAFATAALYPDKIAACVAGMPFLGDLPDHLQIRAVYRPEFQACLDRDAGATWLDVYRSMSLIDTVHLAPRIRCPVLMGTGLFDDDCPSHIGFAVYNALTSDKRYLIYPDEAHLLGATWQHESMAWLRSVFRLEGR